MSDVIRVFVEKKPGFDVEAQHMKADLVENLGMPVEDLKLLNRYDVSGLSREEFEAARGTIFSEPNVDTVYDEEYPLPEGYSVFAMEYLPGQYEAPPTPAVTETPVATPEPTPYVKKIPVMMYFTGREISFPVETVGIVPYTDSKGREVKAEDGSTVYTMGTVDSEKVSAWLDASASPGEYGNAIFNGHVSWKKVAGVFSVLPKMEEGEEIIVEYDDGSTMTFTVTNVDIYGIDDVPETVMAYDTGDSRMTLITCYGESWNSGLGTRNQRCVVVAKPVDSSKIITPPAVTPNPDEDCDT